MRYIFYDTETTGLNASFDQILQFAAIEVDEDFRTVDSINLRCRILPFVVPSPQAMLKTRVTPTMLYAPNLSHLDMMREIRSWIGNRSPCMIIGHNGLRFDEPFIRQAFYQTLHPVYLTNTQGNYRGDTLHMAQAVSIYAPTKLTVPLSDAQRPSFRLGPLTRANHIDFDEADAHDALADVKATAMLAQHLNLHASEIWDRMMLNASKPQAMEFMKRNQVFCYTKFNAGLSSTHLVSAVSSHESDMAVFDMAHAPADYLDASVEDILGLMNGPDRVIRVVSSNKQPIIMDTDIGHAFLESCPFFPAQLTQHVRDLRGASEFRKRVAQALKLRYPPKEPSAHIEERVHEKFPQAHDQRLLDRFHQVDDAQKLQICAQFEDARYRELGLRLLYVENPDQLPESERARHADFIEARIHSTEEVPWRTISKALAEVEELKGQESDQGLLMQIEQMLRQMQSRSRLLAS